MKYVIIFTLLITGYASAVTSCPRAKAEVKTYNLGKSSIPRLAQGKKVYRYSWLEKSKILLNKASNNQVSKKTITNKLKKMNMDAKCTIKTYNTVLSDKIIKDSGTTLDLYQDHLREDAPKHTDLGGFSNQYRNTIIDHYHYMSMIEQF